VAALPSKAAWVAALMGSADSATSPVLMGAAVPLPLPAPVATK
jgi:hypothetical protein